MKNMPSNIHFFLDRTTPTHPTHHHLVVCNSHHATEANQSVSSPNDRTFQAPERAEQCSQRHIEQSEAWQCPLYPRKRTFSGATLMSAKCHDQTSPSGSCAKSLQFCACGRPPTAHDGAHETACFRIAECVATGILRGRPCRSRLECRWCCCRPFVAPQRTSCSAPDKSP
jgi:hypothetical protein